MADQESVQWVLPTEIPFAQLKANDLEECVYWLLDAMGAKDLEWRKGGGGSGAADGGRDLEAHFFEPDEDGEIRRQTWWIECKGRSGTVPPEEVKAAANNALAYENVDRLIIATNTQFSNPTRDWVDAWQKKHPTPTVQLWEHTHLERYLSRHPDVVLRLFSQALSVDGQFRAMESLYWNRLQFIPPGTLSRFWREKKVTELTPSILFAAIANEFANGDITERPWAAGLDSPALVEVLEHGFSNVFYLFHRTIQAGVDQRTLIRTYGYLILAILDRRSPEEVQALMRNAINRDEPERIPTDIQGIFLVPIVGQLLDELKEICSDNCDRISVVDSSTLGENVDVAKRYWLRLDAQERDGPADKKVLIIERHDAACVVGYNVDRENSCPLFACKVTADNILDCLAVIKRVASFRKQQAAK